MKDILIQRRAALLSLGALGLLPLLANAGANAPGDSVYRLAATLTDQDGRTLELDSLQGTPVLASMFYTSCEMVCPMIFETIQATLHALPAADRANVRVLMVSFDPARDTTAALKKAAQAHGCDGQWTLARADEATARKVAAVLGIQYRRLANGEFNHSTIINLLDRQGRITAHSGKLGPADPALVSAVRKVVAVA
jgi:protein SCO1/2